MKIKYQTKVNMQMSDERTFSDGIMQQVTNSDKCELQKSLDRTTTTQDEKIRGNVTSDLNFPTDKLGNCNHFIHEPEELSALYDSRLHFPIISPMFDNKMASSTTQLRNDKDLKLTVNDERKTLTEEDDFDGKMLSLQALDKLESDLSKNKYCTDADVLNALCVFSERASPVNNADLGTETMSQYSFLEKVSSIIQSEMFPDNSSVNSLEYWSDEEGQYLPQMSLSPLPGEPTFRKTTQTVKEPKKYEEKEYLRNLKTSDYVEDPLKSDNVPRTQLKRPSMRTLSPIISKHSPYPSYSHKYQTTPDVLESTSQNITPSFLINSTENVAKSMMSSQPYNWKPRAPDDWAISSPSLVRPTIATPPRTRKNKQSSASTEIFGLNYSSRMKEDKLFETQRCSMPRRKVSRSQSSNTTTTKLFPVISGIAKTQATSKSISDFRQSSSIFGKLVKKNIVKERANDKKKDIDSNKQTKATDSKSTGSSRSKVGETARRKLRRVLSLH